MKAARFFFEQRGITVKIFEKLQSYLVYPVGFLEQMISANFHEIAMPKMAKLFLEHFNGYGLFPTEKPQLILLLPHNFCVIKAWLLRTYYKLH